MIKSLPSRIGDAFEEFGRYIKGKLKEFFTFNFSFGDMGKKIGAGVSAWSKGAADPSGDFDMNVPGSAAGRKTNGQMLSLIGEGAAPEYVIPTESRYRYRALALWQAAGKDLGVPMMADGGITEGNTNENDDGRYSYFAEEPRISPLKVLSDLFKTHKDYFAHSPIDEYGAFGLSWLELHDIRQSFKDALPTSMALAGALAPLISPKNWLPFSIPALGLIGAGAYSATNLGLGRYAERNITESLTKKTEQINTNEKT